MLQPNIVTTPLFTSVVIEDDEGAYETGRASLFYQHPLCNLPKCLLFQNVHGSKECGWSQYISQDSYYELKKTKCANIPPCLLAGSVCDNPKCSFSNFLPQHS